MMYLGKEQGTLFFIGLPENMWVLIEDEESVGGENFRIEVEKEIFNPTNISVPPNSLASIAKRIRRS